MFNAELCGSARLIGEPLGEPQDARLNRPVKHSQVLQPDETALNLTTRDDLFHCWHCGVPLAHADEYVGMISARPCPFDALVTPGFERVTVTCSHN